MIIVKGDPKYWEIDLCIHKKIDKVSPFAN